MTADELQRRLHEGNHIPGVQADQLAKVLAEALEPMQQLKDEVFLQQNRQEIQKKDIDFLGKLAVAALILAGVIVVIALSSWLGDAAMESGRNRVREEQADRDRAEMIEMLRAMKRQQDELLRAIRQRTTP